MSSWQVRPLPFVLLKLSSVTYVALLYFKPLLLVAFPGSAAVQIANQVAVVALLAATLCIGRRPNVPPLFTLGVVVVLGASTFFSVADLGSAYASAYDIGSALLIFAIFAALVLLNGFARYVLLVLGVCAVLNGAVGLWGAITGTALLGYAAPDLTGYGAFGYDAITGRSGGISGENYMGLWSVPGIVAGMYLWRTKSPVVGLIMTTTSVLAALVSLSRTSVLSALVALTLGLVVVLGRSARNVAFALGVFAVVAITAQLAIGKQASLFSDRIVREQSARWSSEGVASNVRYFVWKTYGSAVLQDPLLGQGPGYITNQVERGFFVPHNSALDVAVEFGLLGLVLYIASFVKVLASGLKRGSLEQRSLFASFIGMSVSLLTLSNPYSKVLWLVGGCVVGLGIRGARPRVEEGTDVTRPFKSAGRYE